MAGPRTWIVLMLAGLGCAEPDFEVVTTQLPRSGGELHVRGPFEGRRAALVLVDGVPARAVVIEGRRLLRAQVPALPRAAPVDVELVFGDGVRVELPEAVQVRPPVLDVR